MLTFARTLRATMQLLGPERRWRWLLLVVLALAVTGFEALGAVLVYILLTLISSDGDLGDTAVLAPIADWFVGPSQVTLQVIVAVLVALFFLVRSGVVIGQRYVQYRLIQNEAARLATRLVRGYLTLPYHVYTRTNSSEMIRNAFDSVQMLTQQVLKPAVEVMAELFLLLGMVAVLLVVAPQATLIVLAILLPVVWLLLAFVQPRLKRLGRESQDARRLSLRAMQESLGGFRDIRLLGHEDAFTDAFRTQRKIMARTQYRRATLSEVPRTMIETFLVIAIALLLVLAVTAGEGGESVLASLGVLAYAGIRLQPSLRHVVQGLNHVRFGAAVIEDLMEDRERIDRALRERPYVPALQIPRPFTDAIEFRDVTFAYEQDVVALSDVNLRIRRGEFVGVCGPTGGGKSTLIDLLVGLLTPTSGQVLVDGEPLGSHPSWWYAQIGLVSQHIFLADDTITRNIAFGETDAEIDEQRLARAVSLAQLDDVVRGLPDGLATVVGEQGVRLSGGQRQRIGIARALYREPPVIVLDEGTSALDSATEAALVRAVGELRENRTLISVAHRISTIRDADRVLVLDQGRVVAEGPYDHVLRENALFRSLAR